MSNKEYPFSAWVLTPSVAPKQVELVCGSYYADWHRTESRKDYHDSDLYQSKEAAIEAGWRRLDEQTSALKKKSDNINKKKATLTKHSQVKP